jgi:hypothetical protein
MSKRVAVAAVIAVVVVAGAAATAESLASAGAHSPAHHRAQAAHPVTPAMTSRPATPDANTAACRTFARLAPPLEALLGAASQNPASAASASGGLAALRQAADLMGTWSRTTTDKVTGHSMILLPFDLSLAADELRTAAAGMRDPGATALVVAAVKSVTKVSDDCAALSG